MKTTLLTTLAAIQSISPIGAAAIFGLAFVASYIGLAALLIVAALLLGMHFAKLPTAAEVKVQTVSTAIESPQVITPPALPCGPSVDQFAGLVVREVKLAQPSANGRKPKIVAVA